MLKILFARILNDLGSFFDKYFCNLWIHYFAYVSLGQISSKYICNMFSDKQYAYSSNFSNLQSVRTIEDRCLPWLLSSCICTICTYCLWCMYKIDYYWAHIYVLFLYLITVCTYWNNWYIFKRTFKHNQTIFIFFKILLG